MKEQQQFVLVRGSGDVGSAVAHTLYRHGYPVIIHDTPAPTHSRRGMAFTDAVFDGRAELVGIDAIRCDDVSLLAVLLAARQGIPIVVSDLATLIENTAPAVLVDARMRKRLRPEVQRHMAPLTIGLGPQFVAGETTHLAIETSWGDQLGKVIVRGATKPLSGEPRELAGHGRERFVYAPIAGRFQTTRCIGDCIQVGEIIGSIDNTPLAASLNGVLRGLTRSDVLVEVGAKVVEIDPRGTDGIVRGLGERPLRIAEGVVRAIAIWRAHPSF